MVVMFATKYRSVPIDLEHLCRTRASAPDVILVWGSPPAEALKQATRTIPIVFLGASDPLSSGLVDSLAPNGKLTGFVNYEFSMGGKWLGLLKTAPAIKRVFVLWLSMEISANRGLCERSKLPRRNWACSPW